MLQGTAPKKCAVVCLKNACAFIKSTWVSQLLNPEIAIPQMLVRRGARLMLSPELFSQ